MRANECVLIWGTECGWLMQTNVDRYNNGKTNANRQCKRVWMDVDRYRQMDVDRYGQMNVGGYV